MNMAPPRELLSRAEAGDAESQYSLGAMYGAGEFVKKDDREAARWYLAAAEQGHVEAQRNLGLMYLYGEGLERDFTKGIDWIVKAAHGGSIDAMKALATAYEHGLYGLVKDLNSSSLWERLANENEKELGGADPE